MAAGQAVLTGSWDVADVRATEDRLERRGVDAGRVHAATLRDVLALHDQHLAAGLSLMTEPVVARLLRVSPWRATRLLTEAAGLAGLPQGFEALEWGLLHPEQCSTALSHLGPLDEPQRLELWQRLLDRLGADAVVGAVLPPARLGELLKRWVLEIAPQDAVERRTEAEQERKAVYRKREDGLADLFLIGMRPTDAQAVLQRVRDASAPVGLWDERTADQRRLDAAVDLLLGRHPQGGGCGSGCAAACGCLPGQPAPCGAMINVHVPLDAALGSTDEPAAMDRHGPIEPDLLQALLLNGPMLRAVFVNEHGTPVGLSKQRIRPERRDPASVREALLRVARLTPERIFPIHLEDHGPPGEERADRAAPGAGLGTGAASDTAAASTSHPPDTDGRYQVRGLLRDLLQVRAPRCDFPGCGMPSDTCDAEHDVAWPLGPSCSCNLGPCCRHHHRLKQRGWTKTRHGDGSITWTDPTGRSWLSRAQHDPPQPAARPAAPVPSPNPWAELSPADLEHELWLLADRPDDPLAYELRVADLEPDDLPPPERDTRWTFDLDEPYAWLPGPAYAG